MEESRTGFQSGHCERSSVRFCSEDDVLQEPCVGVTLCCISESLTLRRAYEIKTLHGREPPPIEILEKLTAKGGDILSRTVENFRPPQRSSLVNGDSESGGEDSKTPKDEKMDIDEPGSVGRSSRGELVTTLMVQLICEFISSSCASLQVFAKLHLKGSLFSRMCHHLGSCATHLATLSHLNQQLRPTPAIITPHPRTRTAHNLPLPTMSLVLKCL